MQLVEKAAAIQTERSGLSMCIGLVLEGGGNRGAYSAGVLDVLCRNDIYIPVTYAVSAGGCNAMSYLSKQIKRNFRIYTEYAADKRYCSLRNLMKTGCMFGYDFIFGEIADKLIPFDYEEFDRTTMKLFLCSTNVETGEAVFIDNKGLSKDLTPLVATASLPVVSNIVEYKGMKLLDGGVASPIPIDKAISDGITRNIVVLTRDKEYVKKDKPDFPLIYLRHKYKKYPQFVQAMIDRPKVYNRQRELCYSEQEAGRAIVIQPSKPIKIKRSCKDPEILEEIYNLGVKDATERLPEINRFIAVNE